MKRPISILLFLVLVCLCLQPASAAAYLPDNLGRVQDRGGLFTAEEKKTLRENAAGEADTRFYILTLTELNGSDPAAYATSVYRKWKLSAADILLVLSVKEHRVEMNFHNAALQRKLDSLPEDYDGDGNFDESKITEVVDKHFIPLAKKGDFAAASRELMRAVYRIGGGSASPKPAAAQPAPVKPTAKPSAKPTVAPTAAASPTAAATAPAPTKNSAAQPAGASGAETLHSLANKAGRALAAVLLFALLLAAVGWPTRRFIRGFLLKRKLSAAQNRLASQMGQLSQALTDLSPFTSMSQGKTSRSASDLEKRISALLIQAEELHRALEAGQAVFVMKTGTLAARLQEGLTPAEEIGKQAEAEAGRVRQLVETDRMIAPFIERLKETVRDAERVLEEAVRRVGAPLPFFSGEWESLKSLTRLADDTDEFDPVSARESADGADRTGARLIGQLQSLIEYADHRDQYPALAAACRDQVKTIVDDHRLHAISGDPYAKIKESDRKIDRLTAELKLGHLPESERLWSDSQTLLKEAVADIERIARLRLDNRELAAKLEARIRALEAAEENLANEFERISAAYTPSLWKNDRSSFEAEGKRLDEGKRKLAEGNRLTADDCQQFEKAERVFGEVENGFAEVDEAFQKLSSKIRAWDESYARLPRQFAEDAALYADTNRYAQKEELVLDLHEVITATANRAEQQARELSALQGRVPCPLQEWEQLGDHYRETVQDYRNRVMELGRLKQEVAGTLKRLTGRFQAAVSDAEGFFHKRQLKKSVGMTEDLIVDCLKSGHYPDAHPHLQAMEEMIAAIEQANRERMRTENAQRILAAQERANQIRIEQTVRVKQERPFWGAPSRPVPPPPRPRSGGSPPAPPSGSSGSSSGGSNWGSSGGNSSGGNSSGGSNW